MNFAIYIVGFLFTETIRALLMAVLSAMYLRMILSFFDFGEESNILLFTCAVTEPFIVPVRIIVERFESVASMPIDISFCISFIILSMLRTFLPAL